MARNDRHFCVIATPRPVEGESRAALLRQFKWDPGTQIRVQFLEGDQELRDRVSAVAQTWVCSKMANLGFRFDDDEGTGAMRMAFWEGDGSWSYLGTVAQQFDVSEPTMNYGWLTATSDEDELRRVVQHEFGHALGLIHEHQNPDHPISWNRAAVIADLSGPPNNWDLQTIEHNIFQQYDPATLSSTPTDAQSIMMYPIPARWTTDGFSAGLNRGLSETDQQFIRTAYPW